MSEIWRNKNLAMTTVWEAVGYKTLPETEVGRF